MSQRQKKGKEHQREEDLPFFSEKEIEEAQDKWEAAGVQGLKPALGYPIFFHIYEIPIGIGKKKEKNIFGCETPYRGLLVGNPPTPD